MRITHLRLRDFLAYEDLDLDLTQAQQIAIAGHVGAGKSSLLDGIMWSLFGEGRTGADAMIRKGQDEAYAAVDAVIDRQFVQVARTRKLNRSTSLTVTVDGEDRTQHTISETQDLIYQLIGMPYDALMAGPIMVQGKSDELMRVPASERRDLLGRLFGLDRYERYHESAKERLAGALDRRARAEAVLEELDRLLEGKDALVSKRLRLGALESEHERLVDQAESTVNAAREEATALLERSQQLTSVDQLVTSLQARLDVNDRQREARKNLETRLAGQASVISDVPCGGEGIYATCPLLTLAFKAKDEQAAISYADLDAEYDSIAQLLSKARQDRLRLSNDAERIEEAGAALREADARLLLARQELDAVEDDLKAVTADLKRIAEAEERRKEVMADFNTASHDASVLEVLVKAFHRTGIPTMELQHRLPLVEQEANRVLARLPGNLSLQLQTQVLTKSKTMRETLEILVNTAAGDIDYQLLSGGERFQVDFALRLGISTVIAHRAGHSIDTLWLDEGWGTQDERGREAMLQAIAAVADRFDLIALVSHVPEVTDRLPARLEVSKIDGVSHAAFA